VTVKTRRGFTRLEWQKLRERNEALDCRVYARAAAWIAGADRWSERKWQELKRQLGIRAISWPPVSHETASVSPQERTPADPSRERRGVASERPSGWLGGRSRDWLRRR